MSSAYSDIPHANITEACKALQTYSTTFTRFYTPFGNYTDMFNFFVNIDAYKDNNLAFKQGSNQFFALNHSDLGTITDKLSNFKHMMRDTMNDLEKIKMCYLLHVHKLKYKTGGKIPSPDIVQYLPPKIKVYSCFDSGSGPPAIFGDSILHAAPIQSHSILCSVANTQIDPGPSGANCDVHIEKTYKPKMNSTFFSKFGYANNINFDDIGNNSFTLNLNGNVIDQSSSQYLSGNNENNKYFSTQNAKKLECDIRTTLKKLGDDLQVFISCLYKLYGGIGTDILVMMLTCDLGVSFMSLILGVDCVFKDKDEEQKIPGEKKIGNSRYIKSLLGAPKIDWSKEITIARKYVLSEYDDFITVIDDIITKISSNSNITIQIKGDMSYGIDVLPNSLSFFEAMKTDLTTIRDFLSTVKIEDDSSAIDALKKCVPNTFLLRHKTDPNIYLFTLAQKYTRGDIIHADTNNGSTGKTKNTPFVAYFKNTYFRKKLVVRSSGGAILHPLNEYFIDTPIFVDYEYSNTNNLQQTNNETHVYDTTVNPPLYKYTSINEQVNLYEVIILHFYNAYQRSNVINDIVIENIYKVDDLLCSCCSYVDDALNGYANYDKIIDYVKEYMDMLTAWYNETKTTGISVPITSILSGKRPADAQLYNDFLKIPNTIITAGGKSTRSKLRKKISSNKHTHKRKTRKNQLSTQYKRHGKRTSKNGFHHERSE